MNNEIIELVNKQNDTILKWQEARKNACADGITSQERTQRIQFLAIAEMELAALSVIDWLNEKNERVTSGSN